MIVIAMGQALMSFNVLVTSSPKELAADVGSLHGVTNNRAVSVGTAVMSTLVVGLLSPGVLSSLTDNPIITTELQAQVDLDNINFLSTEREKGKSPYQAILEGGVSKMRPVCMVVLTTVLGMIPLLLDPFFGAMAAGLMFGLAFATVLCLIVTPVLYAIFFGVRETAAAVPEAQSMRQPVEVKGNVAPVAQTNPPI
jgi:AcrB/AcrD/AcrF family